MVARIVPALALLGVLTTGLAAPVGATAPTGRSGGGTASAPAVAIGSQIRWVRLEANLFVDTAASLRPRLEAAQAAGANGILLSDSKVSSWPGYGPDDRRFWLHRARQLRDLAQELGMSFVLSTDPLGYCDSLLSYDVNSVAGVPIRRAPLVVRGRHLVPVPTASLRNGSFEEHRGDRITAWSQDGPGTSTLIDDTVAHHGGVSVRLEPTGDMTRVFGTVRVRPFQQYVLSFWAKASGLTASSLGPYVASESGRRLTDLQWSDRGRPGSHYSGADGLDLGWTQQRLSFNSRESTKVVLGLGAWGHTAGTLWLDDVRVSSAPTLNLVRRAGLPLRLLGPGGRLVEGRDIARVRDPELGHATWPGTYDTYHRGPAITLRPAAGLSSGQRVVLSGQAATVTMAGQVACSWNSPSVLALIKRVHAANQRALHPDGFMLDLDEVRAGGWDPEDLRFPSSAAAFSHHLRTVLRDLREVAPGVPVYVWSDMLDPTQNAVGRYYQVRGSMERSWRGIAPRSVVIVNWKSGGELTHRGERSIKHFARLGFTQVLAGFYDEPVARNHDRWVVAAGTQPRIVGSMYTTWEDDFSALAEYGSLWW
jgi:hypothetical protein